jgi:hypothetical protein
LGAPNNNKMTTSKTTMCQPRSAPMVVPPV